MSLYDPEDDADVVREVALVLVVLAIGVLGVWLAS